MRESFDFSSKMKVACWNLHSHHVTIIEPMIQSEFFLSSQQGRGGVLIEVVCLVEILPHSLGRLEIRRIQLSNEDAEQLRPIIGLEMSSPKSCQIC